MKIICFGRNYAGHAKEMNSEVPSEPIFFLKPDTALLKENKFFYPDFTNDLHHEIELVLRICRNGKHISEEYASNYYEQIGLGIDFTARDIQLKCKEKGLPWEKAKAFDNSALISDTFLPCTNQNELKFSLLKNDVLVQRGNTNELLFSFDQLIVHVSQFITLRIGDLIYTGTPKGVGAVQVGDCLEGFIGNQSMLKIDIK